LTAHTNTVNLHLKVTPNARVSEIAGYIDGTLHVKIAAPPVKGKANRELTAFLSHVLGINKSALSIIKGQTNRNKVITIEGLNHEDIMKRLSL